MEHKSDNRKEFPRLSELQDSLASPPPLNAYGFHHQDNAVVRKHFRDIETDLQALDSASWAFLKADLMPLLTTRDVKRGWQALFDKLNEAKGYSYLVRLGCTNVQFVPRSSTQGQKTPDLQAKLGLAKVLCEVKTINVSEEESAHRRDSSVRSIPIELPAGFFNKLKVDLETARCQMIEYSPATSTKKIAFLVVNYDDLLHQFGDHYLKQIEAFIATGPVNDLEIVVDAKPPFYSATA